MFVVFFRRNRSFSPINWGQLRATRTHNNRPGSCSDEVKNMRYPVFVAAAICVLGCYPSQASPDKPEWEGAIRTWIDNFVEAWNAQDVDRTFDGYSSDCHVLIPGHTLIVGREEIKEIFRNKKNWGTLDFMQVENIRFQCEDGAVAEKSFSGNGRVGKGVNVFGMEDGAVKVFTDVFDYN